MELVAIFKRVIGLDVHQGQVIARAILEEADGQVYIEQRQFGAFQKDRRALAEWCAGFRPQEVVMESTGIYWKSPYAALEAHGIQAKVVNARHVKQVPGRKTDIGDAQWLAMLARAELRLIARQRQKLVGLAASEKNRLHKVLTDGGIRLGVVVSDIHGQSARAMVKALIQGAAAHEVLPLASRRLKASREELLDALQGDLTDAHRFVLDELMRHIEELEARIARFDARLLEGLKEEHHTFALLQTLPGVDVIGAAMAAGGNRQRHERLWSCRAPRFLGGLCPGNHESAGKRQSGRQERQSLCASSAVRVRPCRKPHPLRLAGEVPDAGGAPRTQTSHHRSGPQAIAHPLRHALAWPTLPGFGHRL
jgi:transposase